jgi:hypothetical protein
MDENESPLGKSKIIELNNKANQSKISSILKLNNVVKQKY